MNQGIHWQRTRLYIAAFAMGWVSLSVLIGLFRAFEILETSREIIAGPAFLAAFKMAMFWILIGVVIFGVPLLAYMRSGKNRTETVSTQNPKL